MGRWWKEIKNISGSATRDGEWYHQLIDNQEISSAEALCHQINEFFVGLTSSFPPLTPSTITDIDVQDVPSNLFVSVREAFKSLSACKTRKSPGHDAIPNVIFKLFAHELKSAVVRPLPKTSPPKCVEDDIRPISLTSQLAKMMEGFTLVRVLPNVLPHLDTKQFAVAGKSTTHAITYLLHLALEALNRGKCWINLFFADFRKGFDLIDHNILLSGLNSFNIHPALLRWVAAFLLERSQHVKISSASSSKLHINRGIPQGTSLAPLLFAVMVNNLFSYWGSRAKYVHDLTVMEIVPGNSPSIMRNIVDNINRFAADSHMRLNPKKCKSMEICFLQHNSYSCPALAVEGSTIERVKSHKFLGVLISSDLSWGCDYIY